MRFNLFTFHSGETIGQASLLKLGTNLRLSGDSSIFTPISSISWDPVARFFKEQFTHP
jgi:hypothetical protein